jgi:hypothetical protein
VVLSYPYCHSLVSLLPHPSFHLLVPAGLASRDTSSGFWVLLLGRASCTRARGGVLGCVSVFVFDAP